MLTAILEKISEEDGDVKAFVFDGTCFDAPWHYHPEFELTYIVEGTGIRYVGNHVESYEAGDCVLLGSSLPHSWRTAEGSMDLMRSRSYVIQWSKGVLPEIQEMRAIHLLLVRAQSGLKFEDHYKALFEAVIHEKKQALKLAALIVLLDTLSSDSNIYRLAGESYKIDVSSITNSRIDLIHEYLNSHFHETIRLEDMADQINMTKGSFSRFFSQRMHKPFFSFLNEYRVNRVSRLLIETDKQVAELAFACGYDSLPFFFKQFKKYKNCTPRQFRQLYERSTRIMQ